MAAPAGGFGKRKEAEAPPSSSLTGVTKGVDSGVASMAASGGESYAKENIISKKTKEKGKTYIIYHD